MEVMVRDNYNSIGTLKEDVAEIKKDISIIKGNHLPHLGEDMATVKTDIDWMKKRIDRLDTRFWIVLITGLSTLAGIVVNTYLTFK